MARIVGVEVPQNKIVLIGLTSIFGIGLHSSRKVLNEAGIDEQKKVSSLTDVEINKITGIIEKNFEVEGSLRQQINTNIRRLRDIRCYRGLRHKNNLPVRGQKTRTNAVTRKGKSGTVGGLKRVLNKK